MINARYVLTAYYWEDDNIRAVKQTTANRSASIAILCAAQLWEDLKLMESSKVRETTGEVRRLMHICQPYPEEDVAPLYLHLKDIADIETFKAAWIKTMSIEKGRSTGSIQRPRHQSIMYKAITDREYRKRVLSEIFGPME